MPVPASELLSNIQRLLLETPNGGASYDSNLWIRNEVLHYMDEVQRRLMLETACIVERDTSMNVTPQVQVQQLPANVISVYAVAFVAVNGTAYCLMRVDRQQGDYTALTWATTAGNPLPWGFSVGDVPAGELVLIPASDIPGYLDLLFVPRAADLSTATNLSVPDELTPGIQWGTTAIMLDKLVGGAEAPERAQYARLRAAEYQAAASIMLRGWA